MLLLILYMCWHEFKYYIKLCQKWADSSSRTQKRKEVTSEKYEIFWCMTVFCKNSTTKSICYLLFSCMYLVYFEYWDYRGLTRKTFFTDRWPYFGLFYFRTSLVTISRKYYVKPIFDAQRPLINLMGHNICQIVNTITT